MVVIGIVDVSVVVVIKGVVGDVAGILPYDNDIYGFKQQISISLSSYIRMNAYTKQSLIHTTGATISSCNPITGSS